MVFNGTELITSIKGEDFCKDLDDALEGRSSKDYRITFSTTTLSSGQILYSALIEYFTFE
jgi:hypothetical protein